jgi:hypothetical protein
MADAEYFREYYKKNRTKRLAQCKEYNRLHAAEKRAYLREYYKANKWRYSKRRWTQEQRDAYNARRRDRYKADPAMQARYRADAKAWQEANPRKRRDQVLRKYGITTEDYARILAEQGGGCAICKRPHCDDWKRRLHVDHCHGTGRVRGLLCSQCNFGVGNFVNDPLLLEAAALYLRTHIGTPCSDN